MLLTTDLDKTIRECEIAGIRSGIEAVRRLYPQARAESIEVAGGLVAFTGVESPLSQAFGVGASVPVGDEEIARITNFYASRGTAPRVYVTPLSDASLGPGLAAAGYAPSEYENVLTSDAFETHARRDDRVSIAEDLQAWARASAQAFMDLDTLKPGDERIASILGSSEGVSALEAREGAGIVATAAMDVRGECAALFAGSTLKAHRGIGWHVALIRERIARARDAGVRFMRATASPASVSERNFRRCGFETLYTRVLWQRTLSS